MLLAFSGKKNPQPASTSLCPRHRGGIIRGGRLVLSPLLRAGSTAGAAALGGAAEAGSALGAGAVVHFEVGEKR